MPAHYLEPAQLKFYLLFLVFASLRMSLYNALQSSRRFCFSELVFLLYELTQLQEFNFVALYSSALMWKALSNHLNLPSLTFEEKSTLRS